MGRRRGGAGVCGNSGCRGNERGYESNIREIYCCGAVHIVECVPAHIRDVKLPTHCIGELSASLEMMLSTPVPLAEYQPPVLSTVIESSAFVGAWKSKQVDEDAPDLEKWT